MHEIGVEEEFLPSKISLDLYALNLQQTFQDQTQINSLSDSNRPFTTKVIWCTIIISVAGCLNVALFYMQSI
mgnify:FL=1